MTSTNDGKEVKNATTSASKGKSHLIEIYKSLERTLTGDGKIAERGPAAVSAWKQLVKLCEGASNAGARFYLLQWVHSRTAGVVLQSEWQSPSNAPLRASLDSVLAACCTVAGKEDWQIALVGWARSMRRLAAQPWDHTVLRALLDKKAEQPSDEEVVDWLIEEHGPTLVSRLRQLTSSKCDDLALQLASAVTSLLRSGTAADAKNQTEGDTATTSSVGENSDVKKQDLTGIPSDPGGVKRQHVERLRTVGDFSDDVVSIIQDAELVLLHKLGNMPRCIELLKSWPLDLGATLVKRVSSRAHHTKSDKKLWKHAKQLATLAAQVLVARCMVAPVLKHGRALYDLVRLVALLSGNSASLHRTVAALAAPADTSAHIRITARAIVHQCGDAMRPLTCELYVRALTAGMNELERAKLSHSNTAEARLAERTLASWLLELAEVLAGNARVAAECTLTAFSVHPSPELYRRVAAACLEVEKECNVGISGGEKTETEEYGATKLETPSTEQKYGSWAGDSRPTHTNLVKTSSTSGVVGRDATLGRRDVVSAAVLDGDGLGLSADLCQDLAMLLRGPRVKTLTWDMEREELLENCRACMMATKGGTQAVVTELKYLHLDPDKYAHLPSLSDDEEKDAYYGIERGYEHHLELEEDEPPENMLWEMASMFSDAEGPSDCSRRSSVDSDYVSGGRQRRQDSHRSEGESNASLGARRIKTSRSISAERREDSGSDVRSGKAKTKNVRKTSSERNKKPKAERKKREKKEKKPKVIDDSQSGKKKGRRKSKKESFSENKKSVVLVDGEFSMDDGMQVYNNANSLCSRGILQNDLMENSLTSFLKSQSPKFDSYQDRILKLGQRLDTKVPLKVYENPTKLNASKLSSPATEDNVQTSRLEEQLKWKPLVQSPAKNIHKPTNLIKSPIISSLLSFRKEKIRPSFAPNSMVGNTAPCLGSSELLAVQSSSSSGHFPSKRLDFLPHSTNQELTQLASKVQEAKFLESLLAQKFSMLGNRQTKLSTTNSSHLDRTIPAPSILDTINKMTPNQNLINLTKGLDLKVSVTPSPDAGSPKKAVQRPLVTESPNKSPLSGLVIKVVNSESTKAKSKTDILLSPKPKVQDVAKIAETVNKSLLSPLQVNTKSECHSPIKIFQTPIKIYNSNTLPSPTKVVNTSLSPKQISPSSTKSEGVTQKQSNQASYQNFLKELKATINAGAAIDKKPLTSPDNHHKIQNQVLDKSKASDSFSIKSSSISNHTITQQKLREFLVQNKKMQPTVEEQGQQNTASANKMSVPKTFAGRSYLKQKVKLAKQQSTDIQPPNRVNLSNSSLDDRLQSGQPKDVLSSIKIKYNTGMQPPPFPTNLKDIRTANPNPSHPTTGKTNSESIKNIVANNPMIAKMLDSNNLQVNLVNKQKSAAMSEVERDSTSKSSNATSLKPPKGKNKIQTHPSVINYSLAKNLPIKVKGPPPLSKRPKLPKPNSKKMTKLNLPLEMPNLPKPNSERMTKLNLPLEIFKPNDMKPVKSVIGNEMNPLRIFTTDVLKSRGDNNDAKSPNAWENITFKGKPFKVRILRNRRGPSRQNSNVKNNAKVTPPGVNTESDISKEVATEDKDNMASKRMIHPICNMVESSLGQKIMTNKSKDNDEANITMLLGRLPPNLNVVKVKPTQIDSRESKQDTAAAKVESSSSVISENQQKAKVGMMKVDTLDRIVENEQGQNHNRASTVAVEALLDEEIDKDLLKEIDELTSEEEFIEPASLLPSDSSSKLPSISKLEMGNLWKASTISDTERVGREIVKKNSQNDLIHSNFQQIITTKRINLMCPVLRKRVKIQNRQLYCRKSLHPAIPMPWKEESISEHIKKVEKQQSENLTQEQSSPVKYKRKASHIKVGPKSKIAQIRTIDTFDKAEVKLEQKDCITENNEHLEVSKEALTNIEADISIPSLPEVTEPTLNAEDLQESSKDPQDRVQKISVIKCVHVDGTTRDVIENRLAAMVDVIKDIENTNDSNIINEANDESNRHSHHAAESEETGLRKEKVDSSRPPGLEFSANEVAYVKEIMKNEESSHEESSIDGTSTERDLANNKISSCTAHSADETLNKDELVVSSETEKVAINEPPSNTVYSNEPTNVEVLATDDASSQGELEVDLRDPLSGVDLPFVAARTRSAHKICSRTMSASPVFKVVEIPKESTTKKNVNKIKNLKKTKTRKNVKKTKTGIVVKKLKRQPKRPALQNKDSLDSKSELLARKSIKAWRKMVAAKRKNMEMENSRLLRSSKKKLDIDTSIIEGTDKGMPVHKSTKEEEVAPKEKPINGKETEKNESGEDDVIEIVNDKEVKYVRKAIDPPSDDNFICKISPGTKTLVYNSPNKAFKYVVTIKGHPNLDINDLTPSMTHQIMQQIKEAQHNKLVHVNFKAKIKEKFMINPFSFNSGLKPKTVTDAPTEIIDLISDEDEEDNSKASDNNHNLVEKPNDSPKFGKWNVIGVSNETFKKYHMNRLNQECRVTIARHYKRECKSNHIGSPEKKIKVCSEKKDEDFLVAMLIPKSNRHPVVVAKNMPLEAIENFLKLSQAEPPKGGRGIKFTPGPKSISYLRNVRRNKQRTNFNVINVKKPETVEIIDLDISEPDVGKRLIDSHRNADESENVSCKASVRSRLQVSNPLPVEKEGNFHLIDVMMSESTPKLIGINKPLGNNENGNVQSFRDMTTTSVEAELKDSQIFESNERMDEECSQKTNTRKDNAEGIILEDRNNFDAISVDQLPIGIEESNHDIYLENKNNEIMHTCLKTNSEIVENNCTLEQKLENSEFARKRHFDDTDFENLYEVNDDIEDLPTVKSVPLETVNNDTNSKFLNENVSSTNSSNASDETMEEHDKTDEYTIDLNAQINVKDKHRTGDQKNAEVTKSSDEYGNGNIEKVANVKIHLNSNLRSETTFLCEKGDVTTEICEEIAQPPENYEIKQLEENKETKSNEIQKITTNEPSTTPGDLLLNEAVDALTENPDMPVHLHLEKESSEAFFPVDALDNSEEDHIFDEKTGEPTNDSMNICVYNSGKTSEEVIQNYAIDTKPEIDEDIANPEDLKKDSPKEFEKQADENSDKAGYFQVSFESASRDAEEKFTLKNFAKAADMNSNKAMYLCVTSNTSEEIDNPYHSRLKLDEDIGSPKYAAEESCKGNKSCETVFKIKQSLKNSKDKFPIQVSEPTWISENEDNDFVEIEKSTYETNETTTVIQDANFRLRCLESEILEDDEVIDNLMMMNLNKSTEIDKVFDSDSEVPEPIETIDHELTGNFTGKTNIESRESCDIKLMEDITKDNDDILQVTMIKNILQNEDINHRPEDDGNMINLNLGVEAEGLDSNLGSQTDILPEEVTKVINEEPSNLTDGKIKDLPLKDIENIECDETFDELDRPQIDHSTTDEEFLTHDESSTSVYSENLFDHTLSDHESCVSNTDRRDSMDIDNLYIVPEIESTLGKDKETQAVQSMELCQKPSQNIDQAKHDTIQVLHQPKSLLGTSIDKIKKLDVYFYPVTKECCKTRNVIKEDQRETVRLDSKEREEQRETVRVDFGGGDQLCTKTNYVNDADKLEIAINNQIYKSNCQEEEQRLEAEVCKTGEMPPSIESIELEMKTLEDTNQCETEEIVQRETTFEVDFMKLKTNSNENLESLEVLEKTEYLENRNSKSNKSIEIPTNIDIEDELSRDKKELNKHTEKNTLINKEIDDPCSVNINENKDNNLNHILIGKFFSNSEQDFDNLDIATKPDGKQNLKDGGIVEHVNKLDCEDIEHNLTVTEKVDDVSFAEVENIELIDNIDSGLAARTKMESEDESNLQTDERTEDTKNIIYEKISQEKANEEIDNSQSNNTETMVLNSRNHSSESTVEESEVETTSTTFTTVMKIEKLEEFEIKIEPIDEEISLEQWSNDNPCSSPLRHSLIRKAEDKSKLNKSDDSDIDTQVIVTDGTNDICEDTSPITEKNCSGNIVNENCVTIEESVDLRTSSNSNKDLDESYFKSKDIKQELPDDVSEINAERCMKKYNYKIKCLQSNLIDIDPLVETDRQETCVSTSLAQCSEEIEEIEEKSMLKQIEENSQIISLERQENIDTTSICEDQEDMERFTPTKSPEPNIEPKTMPDGKLNPDDIYQGKENFDFNFYIEKLPQKTYSHKKPDIPSMKRKLIPLHRPPSKRCRKGLSIDLPKSTKVDIDAMTYKKEIQFIKSYNKAVALSDKQIFLRSIAEVDLENMPTCSHREKKRIVNIETDMDNDSSTKECHFLFEDMSEKSECTDRDTFYSPIFSEEELKLVHEPRTDHERMDTECEEEPIPKGFGEVSDRVITSIIGRKNTFALSAATLSDVKQQPHRPSEDSENDKNTHNGAIGHNLLSKLSDYFKKNPLGEQTSNNILKPKVMRSRVAAFDYKPKLHVHTKHTSKLLNLLTGVPGLDSFNYIQPTPYRQTVQVVQVGQLPVTAAAQNPSQVSCNTVDTSAETPASQCSDDAAQHEETLLNAADFSELNETPKSEESSEATNLIDATNDVGSDLAPLSLGERDSSDHSDQINVSDHMQESDGTHNHIDESAEEAVKCFENEVSSMSDIQMKYNETVTVTEHSQIVNSSTALSADTPVQIVFTSPMHQNNFTQVETCVNKDPNGFDKNEQFSATINNAMSSQVNRAQALVNMLSQKLVRSPGTSAVTQPTASASQSKPTAVTTMSLQQALAQILPPPLSQSSSVESPQQNSVNPQVLHIVQGKSTPGQNQITLVDNSQHQVLNSHNAQVLHIVQNKSASTNHNTSNNIHTPVSNAFGGISLVETGIQQTGNQVLHIVNTGNQAKMNATAQLLKRVNLLTSLTNVQGANEQKMVQFVCKSADGKSIQLNAPHQRSMVLRLQPIETPSSQNAKMQEGAPPNVTIGANQNKKSPQADQTQQEIKSRSVYEENYAKFIQNSTNKTPAVPSEKSTSLPKFNQAFGKAVFQDATSTAKANETDQENIPLTNISVNVNDSGDQPTAETAQTINIGQTPQLSNPPLLIRKSQPTPQQNLVQQLKQTIAPMNIQTMHGGVIYTRQIPVNIGGGQTINLITVPSTELIDDSQKTQEIKFTAPTEGMPEQSIIKIIPQSQQGILQAETASEESNQHAVNADSSSSQAQTQPLLTQMRIKLPMLSKTPQVVPGARVVRPFLQIQRNVIAGTNQPVYQQLLLTTTPHLGQQNIRLPQMQPTRQVKVPAQNQASESNMSTSTLEQLREFDMVLEQVKERSTVQPNTGVAFTNVSPQASDVSPEASNSTVSSNAPREVLYSIGANQTVNVTYVNQKVLTSISGATTFTRTLDTSLAGSSTSQIPHSSNSPQGKSSNSNISKVASKSVKSKSSKPVTLPPAAAPKASAPVPPKTSIQKPLEDEQTTQRILYILAEYKEQVENSPDKDKPAPRRRSNPPTNPSSSSKRKKSSSGGSSKKPNTGQSLQELSPVGGVDDPGRTMGSEDSSCGLSQGECPENGTQSLDGQSPQGSPQKVARKILLQSESEASNGATSTPQPRNVIIADGQAIAVARPGGGKAATAVLMPANYLLPVSMVKGGQQITIVTSQGPKLLTVPQGEGGANALLLQRLVSPAGLKPMLTRPGVRHVRLPTFGLASPHTVTPANRDTLNWIDNGTLGSTSPKVLMEYTPNVTVGTDLASDSVVSETQSDVPSLRGDENASIGGDSVDANATIKVDIGETQNDEVLTLQHNSSPSEGVFSGQSERTVDSASTPSHSNAAADLLMQCRERLNQASTPAPALNLIQVHSLGVGESQQKLFSVQNAASLSSLLQLASKSGGQTLQSINLHSTTDLEGKAHQDIQESGASVMFVRKQSLEEAQASAEQGHDGVKILPGLVTRGMTGAIIAVQPRVSEKTVSQHELSVGQAESQESHQNERLSTEQNTTWRLVASSGNNNTPSYSTFVDSPMAVTHEDRSDHTVLGQTRNPYSPDATAHQLFDKMFDASDTKKVYVTDLSHNETLRVAHYEASTSHAGCDDKPFIQNTSKKQHEAGGSTFSVHSASKMSTQQAATSAAALRHKYAILEHELRLQKSLSEECEDLGVDSPSASELFPEAELLFAASPAHLTDHSQDAHPAPPLLAATPQGLSELEAQLEAAAGGAALDAEEFARAHPNTTFHSELPDDDGEVQPYTISGGAKTRHIYQVSADAQPPTHDHVKYSVPELHGMLHTAPPHQLTTTTFELPETNVAQVIHRNPHFLMHESGVGESGSVDSSVERHSELFWDTNSNSNQSEPAPAPLRFSSECSNDSDSVIKETDASSSPGAEDSTQPPLRTYLSKRSKSKLQTDDHNAASPHSMSESSSSDGPMALNKDTMDAVNDSSRSAEQEPGSARRRTSVRGVVKRGCLCCNGSPAPSKPKKPRQKKSSNATDYGSGS